jgi:hypothetical protein
MEAVGFGCQSGLRADQDHRSDRDEIAKWLSNKTPEIFISWIVAGGRYVYVADKPART